MTTDEAARLVKRFYITNKRMPSYQELGSILGIKSKKNSYKWGQKLIDTGLLGKDEKGKLFPKNLFTIPDYGVIRAGYTAPAHPVDGDSLDLYQFILDLPSDVFSLTVHGDSMKDALISEGDIAIVDRIKEPHNGDIVAALVDGEVTLKYYYSDKKGVRLVPANPDYPTIYPKQELYVEGVVIHIIRKLR